MKAAVYYGIIMIMSCVIAFSIHAVLPASYSSSNTNPLITSALLLVVLHYYTLCRPPSIYLIDYACFKPPNSYRVPLATFMEHAQLLFPTSPKSTAFQTQIMERAGIGDRTCIPPPLHYIPIDLTNKTLKLSSQEAELILIPVMDALLAKTGIRPDDIDILVSNCGVFNPTPSLTSMVVNRYKLRNDIKTFNLSGMGCSAGIISLDLARDVLLTCPNSTALVLSTEIITQSSYLGKERSMLLPNCLFRMGGAAILLSNRSSDRGRAKYELMHVVRTHMGHKDQSYKCIFQEEDPEGFIGINLSRSLPEVAAEALKTNITTISPLLLPLSEKLRFFRALVATKLFNKPSYVPNFRRAVDHFCIHAGGRAVIENVQKKLDLSDEHVEPSRMTLHRFGNTSSSSLWYELSYIEAKGRMKKGDRVWQIGFGSGFKCNSAVWKCKRTIKSHLPGNPWADCIHQYPV
ncbi:unnamed protein product [Cuscuta campestris]|uniref:3-ketoacyl-CoA synthase n=1 Tax=Cuscuta campestris TaxID=132261 RepID=A0A484LNH8_9ASTE|nr:unnamed protein product [Cuscuta campestris]